MKKLFHPSDRKLIEWLNGAGDLKVDDHLTTCSRCAEKLEALSGVEEDQALKVALVEALKPEDDLAARVTSGVADRVESREVLEIVSELFVSGLETSKILVTEEI